MDSTTSDDSINYFGELIYKHSITAKARVMDSTTSDDSINYFGELIYKHSFTAKARASSSVAGAKAMVAACDKNATDTSNDDAAEAAERANNSRNSVPNEVMAQTRKSPHLYPPPSTSAETSHSLDLLATVCAIESDTCGMISAPAAAPSRDTLTLAQLYHPSRRLRHHGHNSSTPHWKYTTPPPPPQGNAVEVATAGMIASPTAAPFHDILTLSQRYRPIRQTTRNRVKSSFIRQDSNDCVTLSCSVSSSDAAEQIWQQIQNDISNTNEDDWSFNGSPHLNAILTKVGIGSTKSEEAMIPGAIAFIEQVDEDKAEKDHKRRRMLHNER